MDATDTKNRILEAAVTVFAQKGYHETRVDDIVAESRTSKGSVYFYFSSKREIFIGIIDLFIGLLEDKLNEVFNNNEHGTDQVNRALYVIIKLFSQYRLLAKIVLIQAGGSGSLFENYRREINQRFISLIKARLDRAVETGSIKPSNTELIARLWVGALSEVIINWLQTGEPDLESSIPEIQKILIRSLGNSNH